MSRLPANPAPGSSMDSIPTIDMAKSYTGPPRVFLCAQCSTRIAHTSRVVSTAYRGHAGKAALFTETRNVALDPPSILLMDSGAYTIQEFICTACEAYLGWKFARAHDGSERWKEGHYVLELELVSPAPPSPNDDFAFAFDADAEADELQARAEAEFGVGMGMGVGMEREGMGMERERERTGVLAIARESPLVKMQMQVQAEQQEQIHKRSMSAGPPRPGQPQPLGKGGAREGYRSLQAGPKQMGVQPMRRVERDSDGREGGPFWKPR